MPAACWTGREQLLQPPTPTVAGCIQEAGTVYRPCGKRAFTQSRHKNKPFCGSWTVLAAFRVQKPRKPVKDSGPWHLPYLPGTVPQSGGLSNPSLIAAVRQGETGHGHSHRPPQRRVIWHCRRTSSHSSPHSHPTGRWCWLPVPDPSTHTQHRARDAVVPAQALVTASLPTPPYPQPTHPLAGPWVPGAAIQRTRTYKNSVVLLG